MTMAEFRSKICGNDSTIVIKILETGFEDFCFPVLFADEKNQFERLNQ